MEEQTPEIPEILRAARQALDTELLLGGQFLPARRTPPGRQPPRPPVASPAGAPPLDGSLESIVAHSGSLTTAQKAELLNVIDEGEVRPCRACRLWEGRGQTVFGEGDPDAALMFVGEGPGEEEDRQGRPFVGRAGQKLDEMIVAMKLRRQDVYIANVVKCRPPGNRAPQADEAETCIGLHLIRQMLIIRPRVIVTLGNPATQNLLKTTIGITRIRGQWQRLPELAPGLAGIPVMPTYHPSYVLRNYTKETRAQVWDDLKKVMGFLKLAKSREEGA